MTPYKLEHGTYNGKSVYAYADKKRGVVYIGGQAAYQRAAAQYKREESSAEAFSVNLTEEFAPQASNRTCGLAKPSASP